MCEKKNFEETKCAKLRRKHTHKNKTNKQEQNKRKKKHCSYFIFVFVLLAKPVMSVINIDVKLHRHNVFVKMTVH